jgi:hypothetical protein
MGMKKAKSEANGGTKGKSMPWKILHSMEKEAHRVTNNVVSEWLRVVAGIKHTIDSNPNYTNRYTA